VGRTPADHRHSAYFPWLTATRQLGSECFVAHRCLARLILLRCASSDFTLSRFYELDYLIIIMPSESKYPKIDIPDVDLWGFLFERKDRPFGDDKGMLSSDNTFFNST
jgi:hypothetical protein